VLDLTLHLTQKDEYELAHSMLQSLLTWLCHIRLVEQEQQQDGPGQLDAARPGTSSATLIGGSGSLVGPRQLPTLSGWGATVALDSLRVGWYEPGDQERGVVRGLLERYLVPLLASLDRLNFLFRDYRVFQ
jgi:hypothetical protein